MLDARLRALRNAHMQRGSLPALVFFTPTARFFEALEPFRQKATLVEAGCGQGLVSKSLDKRGFQVVALDIAPRQKQWSKVQLREAESFPYSDAAFVLICRPDHSGWAYDTIEQALRRGARAQFRYRPGGLCRSRNRAMERCG